MTEAELKKYAKEVVKRLAKHYPDSKTHLDHNNAFELLISTVLAAQMTDVGVNKVMGPLYKSKYKKPQDILKDGFEKFRDNIKSINFYNNKAKAVISLCQDLVDNYKGKVPDSMDELTKLKGVGRKTANVVLGNCFGKKDVIIVDTHLKRVSLRLGLVDSDKPDKIEQELSGIIPPNDQFGFSMRIGDHGRQICTARKPDCEHCFLNDICPSAFKV
ncbi:MAG: endonuclease III [Ignavibacteriae bacterium]|nr:endonuclease III [Ignavibacteriota bacterium]MCB9244202.1 endonuclease III [Ignavibacteriales bacterium]